MTARPLKITGQTHGENQVLNDLAEGFNDPGAPPAPAGSPPAPQPVQRPDVFGPTNRPREPLTAGTRQSQGILPQDPASLLRALYVRFPNEDLRRLLERASERF